MRKSFVLVFSVLAGFVIMLIDSLAGWDDTGIIAGLIFIAAWLPDLHGPTNHGCGHFCQASGCLRSG